MARTPQVLKSCPWIGIQEENKRMRLRHLFNISRYFLLRWILIDKNLKVCRKFSKKNIYEFLKLSQGTQKGLVFKIVLDHILDYFCWGNIPKLPFVNVGHILDFSTLFEFPREMCVSSSKHLQKRNCTNILPSAMPDRAIGKQS